MPQLVDLLFKQITLGRLQFLPGCPQFIEDSLEPVNMLLWCLAEDNYVIQIDYAPIQVQLTKTRLHQPLKGCWSIGETKGHEFTFPKAKRTHCEGS